MPQGNQCGAQTIRIAAKRGLGKQRGAGLTNSAGLRGDANPAQLPSLIDFQRNKDGTAASG